uniref:Senescence domain-containing protein n=1 Tax=Oryza nivara TaxID=4536 RepID=A0A0E0III4_ORYNI
MATREGGGGGGGRPPLRVGRTQEYRMGRETQLLAAEGSPPVSLFVLCGDRFEAARLFRSGGLSVRMARVEGHPVSMASCAVGDHHWMLSRDALVARLDARVFVFEMPGFFYAVVVPSDAGVGGGGAERKCATLAEIFSRFCSYHDLSTTQQGEDEAGGDMNQHSNPWVRAHARIQRLKKPTSPPAGAGQATADAAAERAGAGAVVGLASQLERAVRTSAVVKLLSRSLLAGALQPARHLMITLAAGAGGAAANNAAGTSAGAGGSAAALPSKSVVSDLLEAIETSRTSPRREAARRAGGGAGEPGWWSLNVEGVMLLLRVVQAVRGRKLPAPEKRTRDEASDGGGIMGGGGGGAARRWCGGRPKKLGNTVGACGSS